MEVTINGQAATITTATPQEGAMAQVVDDIIAQAEAQEPLTEELRLDEEMKKKLEACEVLMEKEYAPNKFLFKIKGVDVLTEGDIHTIGAKQKGGKTSFVTILIAAMLAGQWNCVKCMMAEGCILYIDTEMKSGDTKSLAIRAMKMAGVGAKVVNERLHMVNFRPLTPQEMEVGIRYYIALYRPVLVFIDGIVDLCANFNDVEMSQNLVLNFLMKIAEKFNCAIVSILHTNKTDGYSELRGHLGAFLEQKGVTTFKCEKDETQNLVTVKVPTHRYAPVPDFYFTFDDDGTPVDGEAEYQEMEEQKQRTKDEKNAAERQNVYDNRAKRVVELLRANGGQMARKQLTEQLMSDLKRKEGTIKFLLKQMLEKPDPVITQSDGLIRLSE